MRDKRLSLRYPPDVLLHDTRRSGLVYSIALAASAFGTVHYDVLAIPTMIIILDLYRRCRIQHGIRITTKLVGCPLVLGFSLGQLLSSASTSRTTIGNTIFRSFTTCFVYLASIVLVDLFYSLWHAIDSSFSMVAPSVILLPTSWTLACMASMHLNHGSRPEISSYMALFPMCLAQNSVTSFLDALAAQELLKAFSFLTSSSAAVSETKHSSLNTSESYTELRSSVRPIHLRSMLCSVTIFISLLCFSLCGVLYPRYQSGEQLTMACVQQHDVSNAQSVLRAVRDQVVDKVDLIVAPVASAYIQDDKHFRQFKKAIRNIIKVDQATVILSTTNFQKRQTCEDKLFRQIFPIGEKRHFVHSYTKNAKHKAVNSSETSAGPMDLGSLFLTWQSKQHVKIDQGRLLVATAICLDGNFPDRMFQDVDTSPDLLIIPASAWSRSAVRNLDRWRALTSAALHHKMRILACDQDEARYLDTHGNTIIHRGKGDFAVAYNIPGIKWVNRISYWWLLLPCGLITIDIVRCALLYMKYHLA